MVIALDYDGTFTADPDFWLLFINMAQVRGHKVILVTMREDGDAGFGVDAVDLRLLRLVDAAYFTAYRAKKRFLSDKGIRVDVWVDDSPEWVLADA